MSTEGGAGTGRPGPLVRRFAGEIAGVGTTGAGGAAAGPRIVVGRWLDSPLGSFADVMLEEPDGHRFLLAPSEQVAEFVGATYTFDSVEIGPVDVEADDRVRVITAPGLALRLEIGRRTPLGVLLRLQPPPLTRSPRWASLLDPIARRVMAGVRTRGSAGGSREEYYGASDLHRITAVEGTWRGTPLGELAPVDPPVRFGFGSAPRSPSLTRIVTTIVGT